MATCLLCLFMASPFHGQELLKSAVYKIQPKANEYLEFMKTLKNWSYLTLRHFSLYLLLYSSTSQKFLYATLQKFL